VKDGVLEDPPKCSYEPKALQCKAGNSADCLTAPQVEAARKIYSGPTNPRTGERIYPGLARGSEIGWYQLAGGPKPSPIAESHFKHLVFNQPAWDFRALDFDRDVALADKLDHDTI